MPMRERGKGDARGGGKRERERRDPLQRKEQMLYLGGGREGVRCGRKSRFCSSVSILRRVAGG